MSSEAPLGIPTELLTKIHNLVEAREKTRSALEGLKRQPVATELDWVEALANEAATRDLNFDGIVSKYKEAKVFEDRGKERGTATEFFLAALDKQLGRYKNSNPETVVYLLKQKIRQLSENRDVHQKDKDNLNERIEKLLLELKNLEGPAPATPKGKA